MLIKLTTIVILLWAGMILGISFLESWVKFKAKLLTKPVGLDVGRTVFSAFHIAQWVLFLLIMSMMLFTWFSISNWLLIVGIGLILIVQTLWLHPQLKHRINMIIAGQIPKLSALHGIYTVLELIKLLLLVGFSINLMW